MEPTAPESSAPLAGQVAIVTGGASGIGRATCRALAQAGAHVVAVDRDAAGNAELAAELSALATDAGAGGEALVLDLDVRSEDDMARMAERATERFGRVDVLVTCAGILRSEGGAKDLVELELSEWNDIVDTNLRGVFLANRAVAGAMVAQKGGQIINLSSTLGRFGRAGDAAYCATKFGVIGLTESLQQEVSRHGVKVNVVLPDSVDTPSSEAESEDEPQLTAERVGEVVLSLLTLPQDTMLLSPVVSRFGGRTRRKKRKK